MPTQVSVTTVPRYFADELGLDVAVDWDAYDWLSLPEQRLCALTAGAVFHDDLDLRRLRRIASEVVAGLVHLSFLIERRYAPYAKRYGTAFAGLPIADRLAAPLDEALHPRDWQQREEALGRGYAIVADAFNELELAPRLTLEPVRMRDWPFAVPWADFPGTLRPLITDPEVVDLAHRWPTGGIDQVRDTLWQPQWRSKVRDLAR